MSLLDFFTAGIASVLLVAGAAAAGVAAAAGFAVAGAVTAGVVGLAAAGAVAVCANVAAQAATNAAAINVFLNKVSLSVAAKVPHQTTQQLSKALTGHIPRIKLVVFARETIKEEC